MTSQKRAESSSFAIGRLEAKKAPTVTKVTQEQIAVTFRALILFVAEMAEMTGLEPLGRWYGVESVGARLAREDR